MIIYLGLFFQLHCREGGTLQTNITCSVWATLGLPPLTAACVLSWSTSLRLPVALPGNCLWWAPGCVHFPDLHRSGSGSRVLPQRHRLSWACVLCPSQVPAAQPTRCLASTLFPAGLCILSSPRSEPLGFLGGQWERRLRCAMYLFWGTDLWL